MTHERSSRDRVRGAATGTARLWAYSSSMMPARAVIRAILSSSVEWICLALMAVLSVDLMLGVFSRYVLASTFTWYDEIARACFVWAVFLGAAVGVKRGAHFRLRLLVDRFSPRLRLGAAVFGWLVVIAFSLALIQQGWAFAELGWA